MIRYAFWFVIVLFLYTPLLEVSDYFLTFGGLAALFIVVARFPYTRPSALFWMIGLSVYPLFVYFVHSAFGSAWSVDLSEFAGSYALWIVSAALLVSAYLTPVTDIRVPENLLLAVLTSLGFLQFIMARLFGSTIGFDIIAPLISFDIYDSYLALLQTEFARAMGTYYEPSIFGRIVATLAAMLLVKSRQPLLPIFYIVVNTITSQSFGLLAMGFLIFAVWYGKLSARWIPLAFVTTLALIASYGFIATRLEGVTEQGSTYIRLIAPLEALYAVLSQYPIGLPLGSNEIVVRYLLAPAGFAEAKITNGVYELILYSGLLGVGLTLAGLLIMLRLTAFGHKTAALTVMMLIFATVASSSFLSIESSLLLFIFILSLRHYEKQGADQPRVSSEPVSRSIAPV